MEDDFDDSGDTGSDDDGEDLNESSDEPVEYARGQVQVLPGYRLAVYRFPRLDAPIVGYLENGTVVDIICTARGTPVVGNYGQVSDLWNGIDGGFVPDVFLFTGTNDPTMPPCA